MKILDYFRNQEPTNYPPSRKDLRTFGIILSVGVLVLWGIRFLRTEEVWMPGIGISFFFLLVALVIPRFLRPVYLVWMQIGLLLGWLMTRVVLSVLFYLFFMPLGLFLRMVLRKDLLQQRFDPKVKSYWKMHEKVTDVNRYRKQF